MKGERIDEIFLCFPYQQAFVITTGDIREMSGRDYFISLAEELPAEELFPFKLLEEAAVSVFSSGPSALQYGEPAGYTP